MNVDDYTTALRVLDQLPFTLKETRYARKKSLRTVAKESELCASTVNRVEFGLVVDSGTLKKLLQWIERNQE